MKRNVDQSLIKVNTAIQNTTIVIVIVIKFEKKFTEIESQIHRMHNVK